MNSPLETGLFLPLRFYNTITEQDRFKRNSIGLSLIDEIYLYADCDTLMPFQIYLTELDDIVDITINLICEDGTSTVLPYNSTEWEFYVDELQWVSYLGTDSFLGLYTKGRYYLQVDIELDNTDNTVLSFYSDIFAVGDCATGSSDSIDYRTTTPSIMDKRLVDINTDDLRIT